MDIKYQDRYLLDAIGGEGVLDIIVQSFVATVMHDNILSQIFDSSDTVEFTFCQKSLFLYTMTSTPLPDDVKSNVTQTVAKYMLDDHDFTGMLSIWNSCFSKVKVPQVLTEICLDRIILQKTLFVPTNPPSPPLNEAGDHLKNMGAGIVDSLADKVYSIMISKGLCDQLNTDQKGIQKLILLMTLKNSQSLKMKKNIQGGQTLFKLDHMQVDIFENLLLQALTDLDAPKQTITSLIESLNKIRTDILSVETSAHDDDVLAAPDVKLAELNNRRKSAQVTTRRRSFAQERKRSTSISDDTRGETPLALEDNSAASGSVIKRESSLQVPPSAPEGRCASLTQPFEMGLRQKASSTSNTSLMVPSLEQSRAKGNSAMSLLKRLSSFGSRASLEASGSAIFLGSRNSLAASRENSTEMKTSTKSLVPQKQEDYIYDNLGGEEGICQSVDVWAELVLADDLIGHHFQKVDMVKMKAMQRRYLMLVLTQNTLPARDIEVMKTAHSRLDLKNKDFDRMKEIYQKSFKRVGKAVQIMIDIALDKIETTRQYIVLSSPTPDSSDTIPTSLSRESLKTAHVAIQIFPEMSVIAEMSVAQKH